MSEAIAGDAISKLTIETGCTFLAEEEYKEIYLLRFPLTFTLLTQFHLYFEAIAQFFWDIDQKGSFPLGVLTST